MGIWIVEASPGILQHCGASRRGEVESLVAWSEDLQLGQHPEGLRISLETISEPESLPG